MSRFLLQRKLMTFADRYSIRDEQGEDAYLARGQWMSIGKKIHVKDREGKEVALLQRKLGTLRPQFVITIPGLPEITVVRELVFLRVQYSVHILDSRHRLQPSGGPDGDQDLRRGEITEKHSLHTLY